MNLLGLICPNCTISISPESLPHSGQIKSFMTLIVWQSSFKTSLGSHQHDKVIHIATYHIQLRKK